MKEDVLVKVCCPEALPMQGLLRETPAEIEDKAQVIVLRNIFPRVVEHIPQGS